MFYNISLLPAPLVGTRSQVYLNIAIGKTKRHCGESPYRPRGKHYSTGREQREPRAISRHDGPRRDWARGKNFNLSKRAEKTRPLVSAPRTNRARLPAKDRKRWTR